MNGDIPDRKRRLPAGVFVYTLAKTGKTLDETVQVVSDEMSAEYPDRTRLAGAIRAGYAAAR